ncbi:6732_t:CDS:2 [Entrophospora sp. SA101]|nr:6732_t:CDS:2 [Entrophospora sp. SA101]
MSHLCLWGEIGTVATFFLVGKGTGPLEINLSCEIFSLTNRVASSVVATSVYGFLLNIPNSSKVLEVDSVDKVKKCLRGLQNGTITAFGGRFRGASYDKNAELIVKQAKRSLKGVIKKHDKGENITIKEVAIVPSSYYN